MRQGYWVIRTYISGSVGEKTKFWIPGERPERSMRKEKSEIKKQEQNEYSSVKNLARLLNANYRSGDVLLGLDYNAKAYKKIEADGKKAKTAAEKAECELLAAEKEAKLCLRRVKRELGKEGEKLKFVLVTSDMDGDTGEVVRVHHHLVIPASAVECFVKKWKKQGTVDYEYLKQQDDYTPVAEYLLKQVRHRPDAKKWTASRNLIRPQPKDRIALSGAELKPPPAAKLLFRSEYRPGFPQYIRYAIPPGGERQKPQ